MTDTTTLADLGVGPNGTIQLELQSADPVNTPIKSYRPRQEYHMPDVITVRVQTGHYKCVMLWQKGAKSISVMHVKKKIAVLWMQKIHVV